MDKIVTSIHQVDLTDIRIPIIATYEDPDDYPNKCVARIFDMDRAVDIVILKDAMEQLNEDIRSYRHSAIYLKPTPYDVPSMRGCWMV